MDSVLSRLLFVLIALCFIFASVKPALANSNNCAEVLVLFARGSGQNSSPKIKYEKYSNVELYTNEKQTLIFFDEIYKRLSTTTTEFISLNDFEGRYNPRGYEAVDVKTGMSSLVKYRTDAANRYFESVKDGAEELAWYLEDKLTSCPTQQVVLGGYSQGAHVVGEALQILPAQFRARIAYTALFGDPKFNSRLPGSGTMQKGLWVRGNVSGLQTGVLGARKEYVAPGLASFGSWCDKTDPVCSGRYALDDPVERFITDYFLKHAHSSVYQEKWIPQAASEMVPILQARLGNGKAKTSVWLNKNDKSYQMDIALVLDGSGSMVNQLAKIKGKLTSLVNSLYGAHWDSRVAVVAYNDYYNYASAKTPYLSKVVQPFTTDKTLVTKAINDFTLDMYPHDVEEAMYSGLMTAFNDLQWRNGAQKKTIVITDAPAKDPDPGGWTKAQVAKRALELDPVSISFVSLPAANGYQSWLDRTTDYLATQTNGITKKSTYSYDVADITSLLDQTMFQPVALLEGDVTGYVNEPVNLSSGGSYDPDGSIKEYKWDCNYDGVFETTTTAPSYSCTYAAPFSNYVTVEVRTQDGGSAKAILWVDVANRTVAAPQAPAAPIGSAERTGESTAKITLINNYAGDETIARLDDEQNVIELYAPGTIIELTDLATETFDVSLLALNDVGQSEATTIQVPAYVAPEQEPLPPVDEVVVEEPEDTPPVVVDDEPVEVPEEFEKVLPDSESNPAWLLELTAQEQAKLDAAALVVVKNPVVARSVGVANTTTSQPATPVTQVAGTTDTKNNALDVPKTVKITVASAVAKPTVELGVLLAGLVLLGLGTLLVLWRLFKNK